MTATTTYTDDLTLPTASAVSVMAWMAALAWLGQILRRRAPGRTFCRAGGTELVRVMLACRVV